MSIFAECLCQRIMLQIKLGVVRIPNLCVSTIIYPITMTTDCIGTVHPCCFTVRGGGTHCNWEPFCEGKHWKAHQPRGRESRHLNWGIIGWASLWKPGWEFSRHQHHEQWSRVKTLNIWSERHSESYSTEPQCFYAFQWKGTSFPRSFWCTQKKV